MKAGLLLLLLMAGKTLDAQQLTGFWKGTLSQEAGGCFPEYFLELQIEQKGSSISGISYDYYNTSTYARLNFTGSFNENNQQLKLVEKKILTFRVPDDCTPCIKTYNLQYKKEGVEEFLVGSWKGKDYLDSSALKGLQHRLLKRRMNNK
jgi:hypothetical protein